MNSLFNVKFNWGFFALVAVLVLWFFPQLSWYSYLAILLTLHQFLLLFYSFGFIIPIRYLSGAFMCLHMLLGPLLAYNGLDNFQGFKERMQIPEAEYFSYVIPAVICFILGLHFNSKNLQGEFIDQRSIHEYVTDKRDIAYLFIIVGFIAGFLSSNLSPDLAFILYLFDGFKYIGVFMLITSKVPLKIIPLIIVFGSIILSSIRVGMFLDLLTWLLFLAAFLSIRYKPKIWVKGILAISFIALSLSIQLLKTDYREATWERGEETGINTLTKGYEDGLGENKNFNMLNLAKSNLRINQGYIITYIMQLVPNKVPHAYGAELMQILEAAIFPRVLSPRKLKAGSREIFIKYTRIPLKLGTSMGLSSIGDAYINFGIIGGCIFMFLLGLFYNEVLKGFFKHSNEYPLLLIFTPLVFLYSIRPDCELQTSLGHLIKSCILLYIVFKIWNKDFKFNYFRKLKPFIS